MTDVKFMYNNKEYILNEENCSGFYNDEERPVEGLDFDDVMELLSNELPYIDTEYFNQTCELCRFKQPEGMKTYAFMELSFSIFTKEGKYISSSLTKGYEDMSYGKLERNGKVDSMYIVMVVICPNCNDYTIELSWIK